ncbi:MAG: MOSC domain-containing protein [Proteobacteria bacterium]|nr:MOSC domain-containing protein [Pseudomonadota bacterium]
MDQAPRLLAVLTGKIAPFRGEEGSAIAKLPLDRPIAVTPLGLAGDEQADPEHHGGPDKALHHYPFDHYPHWQGVLGDHPLLAAPGAFGENLATLGLDEHSVCLGDRFRLGTALIEVSHARKPCWKLDHRFAARGITAGVVKTRRSGWYYRVIEPGMVGPGDAIERVSRGLEQWTMARLFGVIVAGEKDPAGCRELAGLEVLAGVWRARAAELAG